MKVTWTGLDGVESAGDGSGGSDLRNRIRSDPRRKGMGSCAQAACERVEAVVVGWNSRRTGRGRGEKLRGGRAAPQQQASGRWGRDGTAEEDSVAIN